METRWTDRLAREFSRLGRPCVAPHSPDAPIADDVHCLSAIDGAPDWCMWYEPAESAYPFLNRLLTRVPALCAALAAFPDGAWGEEDDDAVWQVIRQHLGAQAQYACVGSDERCELVYQPPLGPLAEA